MQRRNNKCEKLKRDEFSLYVLRILQVSITIIVISFSQSFGVAHCLNALKMRSFQVLCP